MKRSTAIGATLFAGAILCALTLSFVSGCGNNGASIGESCGSSTDCNSGLQCLRDVCTPECQNDLQCGDGYACSEAGECNEVQSQLGDSCSREVACGPGQACRLDALDNDANGVLDATCQADLQGSVIGSVCQSDLGCRSGTCAMGTCTHLCDTDSDCPLSYACVTIPRPLLSGSSPVFAGCLPPTGTLEMTIPVNASFAQIQVPVPSHAKSFSLISRISDDTQLVGVAELTSPSGETLYATPHSPDEFYDNPIRYQTAPLVSTLFVPNTPRVQLQTGVYQVSVGSFLNAVGVAGTAVPEITVVYKLDEAPVLDINFIFLNLESHPCAVEFGSAGMSAAQAMVSPTFQGVYLERLGTIFEDAGITIGEVSYNDISNRPDLDGLPSERLPELLRLSDRDQGVNIFFVRSISPDGIEALAVAAPGPPGKAGTAASGIAVSIDTLCYRDWNTLARVSAHQIGKHLGLFRNREPDDRRDPIDDSTGSSTNLMFYSDFGGTQLSEGQRHVLRLNPTLRNAQ